MFKLLNSFAKVIKIHKKGDCDNEKISQNIIISLK